MFLDHLSAREGLPQGDVMVTLQDSQGFVWLGTEDGLVRYTGHEVYRYAYSRTAKAGLPGNFVNAIVEDKKGDLWVALKGAGLAQWHRATDTFTVYRHDPANANSISSDAVRSVLVDSGGRIWVGTLDAGINILEPKTGSIRHLRHDVARADSLADDQIQTLLQDRAGNLWIGTYTGLDRLHLGSESFTHYHDAAPHQDSLNGKRITQIVEDSNDSIWVGTFDAGLYQLDRLGVVVAVYRHDAARATSISSDDVRAILEDRARHIWIGTAEGLDLLDRGTSHFAHYRRDKSDPDSLADSFVMSLYQDGSGLIWIGTRAGGVDRWNPHSWELGGERPDWLDGKLVTSFADAPDRRVWIGSLGGGLTQFDPATGEWADIDTIVHRKNALGDRRVMSLLNDRQGNLWIGTMASGLLKLTPDGQITSIPIRRGDLHSLSAAGVMTIFEARDGQIWVGTHGGGANILDPASGLVQQLPFTSEASGAVSAENVTAFAEDTLGNVWIGTDGGGLDVAHPGGMVFKVFRHDAADGGSLSANTVYSLMTDARGEIWIATDGGGVDHLAVSKIDSTAIEFRNISHEEGLSSDTVYGVLADTAGRLWLSGNAGLMRYDPVTHAIKTYHREHGLQGEEFDSGAYYRTRDGRICFGGPGGFNIFDPAQLSEHSSAPRLALTGLEILGVPMASATPDWLLQHVALDYRANIVSFDFAALDFTSPARNRIAYRMAGLTDHWIDLGTQHRITLTNLEAGDHILEVRAANADMIWSDAPLHLTIHKNPAPWQSESAYAGYVLALVTVIALGLAAQRRKLQRALAAQQRLESEVALRTHELRDTNQKLLDAGEAKSNFLARMGHELRTPMNGVLGMAELLARTPLSDAQARQTQTIRSSAQTLLQILNDLLDLSKAQAGKIELESLRVDLTQLIEESAALFSGAAETKGLELIVCPPLDDGGDLMGDPLRIRQVLMNIIGNAVKFTERGEVIIKCDVTAAAGANAKVQFSISDTGIGISSAAIERIFEPFTQADETTTRRFGGTGLGLSICRGLVELMGGTISVESQPGVGSTFNISLPLAVRSADTVRLPAPFAGKEASIFTRRPAVGESVRRYLSLLGVNSIAASRGSARPADILIFDADNCARELEAARAASKGPLVIIASAAAIEGQHLEERVPSEHLVRKPVHRDALREAIEATLASASSRFKSRTSTLTRATSRGHVLIVEDEAINAAVAQGYLAELGYSSVWVANGAAAIARKSVEHFDMILMDLNMPGLDGYATASLIRRSEHIGEHIPIVALTANHASDYRDSCVKAGMDDILGKPYTVDQCAALLYRWVQPKTEPSSGRDAGRNAVSTASGVDTATVMSLREIPGSGRVDLYARIVAIFRQSSVQALSQIGAALAAEDLTTARATAHKIKGGAASVGALQFSNLLGELEQACRVGDAARAQALYVTLTAAHPQLVAELVESTARASA